MVGILYMEESSSERIGETMKTIFDIVSSFLFSILVFLLTELKWTLYNKILLLMNAIYLL